MPLNDYTLGLHDVPSYQMPGIPFLSSSIHVPPNSDTPVVISFETVTKFVTVTNTLADSDQNVPMRFGFSENGIKGVENTNYAVLNNGESFEGALRVSKVFLLSDTTLACSASIVAGLTIIDSGRLITNWSGSKGVG